MKKVILNHDAAIDEYMATILLTTMKDVELLSVIVTNADCVAAPAMTTAWKIQTFIDRTDIPLSLSNALGYNPFPWEYRGDCIREGDLGLLQFLAPNPDWPPFPDGDAALADLLDNADDDSLTMLITCPMTTLADALKAKPGRARKIKEMIWMGGAIDVAGNLDPTTLPTGVANPYAEWNAFWDPFAVDWIFRHTDFPLVIFPLDVTDQAAITQDFMSDLLAQGKQYRYSDLAYQSYELVASESFYDMWDVVTTCYLTRPDLFEKPTSMTLEIITDVVNQGALVQGATGRKAEVVLNLADADQFYAYVLAQFARS